MATVNVNFETVVYDTLQTPTRWTPTYTHIKGRRTTCTVVGGQGAATVTTPDGRLKNLGVTLTESTSTSTHTFSIVTNDFVVATFTAVGAVSGPPRGIDQPPSTLPPWEIIIISISAALVCLVLFRALYHHRRLDMMLKKEQKKDETKDATIQGQKPSDSQWSDALHMKDVSAGVPVNDKLGNQSAALKLNTKYIPTDFGVNDPAKSKGASK
ncbi:hypothetical protein TWF481_004490 [Arthrobotrys musiformis]|uniref:Uncharacterized protein n=1 Tax=Arthrobotrys musiformis TaxID=47236 RepID=A0AAV9WJP5_9PEZI